MKFRVLIEQGEGGVFVAVVPACVTRGEKTVTLVENPSTFIPIGMKHRLESPGAAPLILNEVQSHGFLGEDDIERFDDCCNREQKNRGRPRLRRNPVRCSLIYMKT